MTPEQSIKYLQALAKKLGSSQVRAFFKDQSPRVKNEYSLMRSEVNFLLDELTVSRLDQIANRLDAHSRELNARSKALKKELDDLASARKILTQLDKTISIISRVAIFLI